MSNPEQEQRRPGMNSWAVVILAIIVALIAGTIVYFNVDTIDKITGYEADPVIEDIQQELTDSVEVRENPSIVEYLQYRNDLVLQKHQEEVFFNIPTVCLIDILLQHGTSLSIYDIAEIYTNYPETYNIIQSGARAQQFLDSISHAIKKPDVLPFQDSLKCK